MGYCGRLHRLAITGPVDHAGGAIEQVRLKVVAANPDGRLERDREHRGGTRGKNSGRPGGTGGQERQAGYGIAGGVGQLHGRVGGIDKNQGGRHVDQTGVRYLDRHLAALAGSERTRSQHRNRGLNGQSLHNRESVWQLGGKSRLIHFHRVQSGGRALQVERGPERGRVIPVQGGCRQSGPLPVHQQGGGVGREMGSADNHGHMAAVATLGHTDAADSKRWLGCQQ